MRNQNNYDIITNIRYTSAIITTDHNSRFLFDMFIYDGEMFHVNIGRARGRAEIWS